MNLFCKNIFRWANASILLLFFHLISGCEPQFDNSCWGSSDNPAHKVHLTFANDSLKIHSLFFADSCTLSFRRVESFPIKERSGNTLIIKNRIEKLILEGDSLKVFLMEGESGPIFFKTSCDARITSIVERFDQMELPSFFLEKLLLQEKKIELFSRGIKLDKEARARIQKLDSLKVLLVKKYAGIEKIQDLCFRKPDFLGKVIILPTTNKKSNHLEINIGFARRLVATYIASMEIPPKDARFYLEDKISKFENHQMPWKATVGEILIFYNEAIINLYRLSN